MTDEKLKISRIDSKNASGHTKGWFVREYYKGLIISCLFSDKKCGSTHEAHEKAQNLARAWRDRKIEATQTDENLYDWYAAAELIKRKAKAQ